MPEESGRRRSIKRTGAAAALFLGLAAGGYGVASAAGGSGATSTGPQGYGYAPGGPPHERGGHGPRGDHTALTGDTLAKATAAAKAKVPGATVDAAFADDHGAASYVVLVTKADGSHAAVLLDDSFAVVEVRTGPGRGPHGPGGPGDRGRETALTGATLAKVTAAAKAKVPGGTVERAETDADGNAKYEVHMTTAAGKRVTVYVDAGFEAVKVEDAPAHPGGPGRAHP